MDTKKNSSIWKRLFIALLFAGICLGIVLPVYFSLAPDPDYKEKVLDAGWTATLNGVVYPDVTLSSHLFPMTNRGDVLELETAIPKDTNIHNAVLKCYSVHSVVEVYVDDEQIYSYGRDLYEKNKMLGYGYNFIELPQNYEGKTLKVVFTISENAAFEGIPGMVIVNGSQELRQQLARGRFSLLITMFLMGFGILGMILSVYMVFRSGRAFVKVFCVTLLSFLMGCWTLCNGDLIFLFVDNLYVKVCLEYISFFLLLIPFLGYFSDYILREKCPRFLQIYYWLLIGASSILFVTIMITQLLNIIHFPSYIMPEHILMLLSVIFLILYAGIKLYHEKQFDKIIALGFAVALLIAGSELIRFNMAKYFTGFADNKYNSSMSVVALIIIVTLFMDFYIKVTDNMKKEAQQKLLEKLVYIDELTSLVNRRRCDEIMVNLDKEDGKYAIVSLDMNMLKMMNDTYGHKVGDRALQLFAEKLKEAYPSEAAIGRIGGDEFLIIIKNASRECAEGYTQDLLSRLEAYNHTDEIITLSTAWGIAYSYEAKSAHMVYSLADERMYENKRNSRMRREDTM